MKALACFFAVLILIMSPWIYADIQHNPYPVMQPDWETRQQWIHSYQNAPLALIDHQLMTKRGSANLLSHLQYTPSERNQLNCGNCWSWAGTGVMEIALDVQNSVKDRLSVQFLCTCGGMTQCGCQGGWLEDVVTFYNGKGYTVPWSNPGASFLNGDGTCNNTCGDIGTTPNYPITSISLETINTQGVNQNTAIANIKNILDQNKAVWFGFFMPRQADWDIFFNFWDYQTESVIFDPSSSYSQNWDQGGGGHAVLVVGYNDDDVDPANHYWEILNSWGTANGGIRPNGLMRWKMDMSYDAVGYDRGQQVYLYYWQTLDMTYNVVGDNKPVVATSNATSIASTSATLRGSVNPKGLSTIYYFDYGLSTAYGSKTTPASAGSGTTEQTVSQSVSGLTAANTYHFRIVASNSAGVSYGVDRTFTTTSGGSPQPPEVTTDSASSVQTTSASLNGSVNARGLYTTYWFQYGLTAAYGSTTASSSAGTNSYAVTVSSPISGLTSDTLYHCRIVASNSAGVAYGSDRSFITKEASAVIFSEGFEGGSLPSGWIQYYESSDSSGYNIDWVYQYGGYWDYPPAPHSGNYNAYFFDSDYNAWTALVTPLINLGTSYDQVTLTFWHYMAEDFWWGDQDELEIYWATNGGDWELLISYTNDTPVWTQRTIILPVSQGSGYLSFDGISYWGYGVAIDDIEIKGGDIIRTTDRAHGCRDG